MIWSMNSGKGNDMVIRRVYEVYKDGSYAGDLRDLAPTVAEHKWIINHRMSYNGQTVKFKLKYTQYSIKPKQQ